MNKKIGILKKEILALFNIEVEKDFPIFIGELNIEHIKNVHSEDYEKYGNLISTILSKPDYVAKHPDKPTIEFIKEYMVDNEMVLIAVRITQNNTAFVKTMFVMSKEKVQKYIKGRFFEKNY